MNYVGSRFIRQCGRLSLGSAVCDPLNFNTRKVYVFIENDTICITQDTKRGYGVAVTFEKQLGRFAIPIDIIRTMNLKIGDELDVYIDDDKTIIVKKSNYDREIDIVRELAKKSYDLIDDEKRTIDILLGKMLEN